MLFIFFIKLFFNIDKRDIKNVISLFYIIGVINLKLWKLFLLLCDGDDFVKILFICLMYEKSYIVIYLNESY